MPHRFKIKWTRNSDTTKTIHADHYRGIGVSCGMGRSKMRVTNADGTQKEIGIKNRFSMVGINFKNIMQNENLVVKTLKSYTDAGWKIDQVTPDTLGPSSNGVVGIFMTRYFLSKSES